MEVTIYTRQGCPLCDEGVAAAVSVFGVANISLVDVDLDLDLMERYTDRVPVIETVEGVVISEGIVEESTLREFSFLR
ncbi:MAG: glutaredoxin family protein [Actinomycetia bacterium]|nr:glutaredoxin family protein [Actinomycetes bacterium]